MFLYGTFNVILTINHSTEERGNEERGNAYGREKAVIDWGYLKLGGQWLYPAEKLGINENYKEGDAFV